VFHQNRHVAKEPKGPSAVADRKQTREFATTDFTDNTDESRKSDNPYTPAEVGLARLSHRISSRAGEDCVRWGACRRRPGDGVLKHIGVGD